MNWKIENVSRLTQVLWLQSGDEAQDEPGDGRAAEQEPAATARPPTEPQRRQNILRN